jgi:hypothetical protein
VTGSRSRRAALLALVGYADLACSCPRILQVIDDPSRALGTRRKLESPAAARTGAGHRPCWSRTNPPACQPWRLESDARPHSSAAGPAALLATQSPRSHRASVVGRDLPLILEYLSDRRILAVSGGGRQRLAGLLPSSPRLAFPRWLCSLCCQACHRKRRHRIEPELGYDRIYAVMMASPSCSVKSVKSLTFSVASGKS